MRLNLPRPFPPMRIIYGGMAITPFWLARCIVWARTSFTHPHDPYVARRRYWDLYADGDDLMPHVPALDFADQDPHSQRLFLANDFKNFDISDEDIRRSCRAYFANISYLDDRIGALLVAVRDGDFKFIHCPVDPPQLFDLASDPDEMQNSAGDPAYADKMAHFTDLMKARWDLEKFDADVRESQARRHIVYAALRQGHYYPWDYQPLQLASERYMRNHMDLNILEETKRFPRGE